MYYYLFSWWLLQLNWRCVAACEGECVTNLTKSYLQDYALKANPVFAELTRTVQTSLPSVPIGQVNVLIEPIRQKAYDAVHEEVKKGLQLISLQKANNSGAMNLTSDKLASSVHQVVSLVLNETLSTVSKTIATLEATYAKQPIPTSTPPGNVTPEATLSPLKPMQTPGRPLAVSTIPINASGAPKLRKREAFRIPTSRDLLGPTTLNSREIGTPQSLPTSKRSLFTDAAALRGVPRIYLLTDIQAEDLTSEDRPVNLLPSLGETESKTVQSSINPTQITFREAVVKPHQESEGRQRDESILQDKIESIRSKFQNQSGVVAGDFQEALYTSEINKMTPSNQPSPITVVNGLR